MRRWRVLCGLGLTVIAGHAEAARRTTEAAWTTCQFTHGVLVVTAQVGGLTGPFILDTATATSVLDATQASLAGLAAGEVRAPVRFAGRRWPALRVTVAALDARTRAMPTPVTGILGADILDDRVLEVRPEPCRLRLTARPARQGPTLAVLPIERRGGLAYVLASVSDGEQAKRGLMRVATGTDLALLLAPDAARLEGASAGAQGLTASLRAISLGDLLIENPRGALASAASPGVLGEIGEPVWSRYGFVLDLRRGRLTLFTPTNRHGGLPFKDRTPATPPGLLIRTGG